MCTSNFIYIHILSIYKGYTSHKAILSYLLIIGLNALRNMLLNLLQKMT